VKTFLSPSVINSRAANYRERKLTIDKRQKYQAYMLLEELKHLGPDELEFWCVKARTFLVFAAMKNPKLLDTDIPVPSGAE